MKSDFNGPLLIRRNVASDRFNGMVELLSRLDEKKTFFIGSNLQKRDS